MQTQTWSREWHNTVQEMRLHKAVCCLFDSRRHHQPDTHPFPFSACTVEQQKQALMLCTHAEVQQLQAQQHSAALATCSCCFTRCIRSSHIQVSPQCENHTTHSCKRTLAEFCKAPGSFTLHSMLSFPAACSCTPQQFQGPGGHHSNAHAWQRCSSHRQSAHGQTRSEDRCVPRTCTVN